MQLLLRLQAAVGPCGRLRRPVARRLGRAGWSRSSFRLPSPCAACRCRRCLLISCLPRVRPSPSQGLHLRRAHHNRCRRHHRWPRHHRCHQWRRARVLRLLLQKHGGWLRAHAAAVCRHVWRQQLASKHLHVPSILRQRGARHPAPRQRGQVVQQDGGGWADASCLHGAANSAARGFQATHACAPAARCRLQVRQLLLQRLHILWAVGTGQAGGRRAGCWDERSLGAKTLLQPSGACAAVARHHGALPQPHSGPRPSRGGTRGCAASSPRGRVGPARCPPQCPRSRPAGGGRRPPGRGPSWGRAARRRWPRATWFRGAGDEAAAVG